TAQAWDCALRAGRQPSVLCLSRQALPVLDRAFAPENPVARGAYVLSEPEHRRDVTIIATGSEVSIAAEAAMLLGARGLRAAVVSAPCFELFELQPARYRAAVLGTAPRVGENGEFVGMTGFGASAPATELYSHFGITAEAVAAAAERTVTEARSAIPIPA